jgi:hypothetical protein
VIYDNLSADATARILHSVPFQDEITVHRVENGFPQKTAFSDAIGRYREAFDWVAFIDGDEYIVPLGDASLPELLVDLAASGIDGLGIHWRVFGSSGHLARPPGLLTESFTQRAGDAFKANRHVKSIVRLPKVTRMVTPHFFSIDGRYELDDGSEPAPDFAGLGIRASYQRGFAIHHYITKSREQCMRKIARGRPKPIWSEKKYRPPTYFESYDRNEIEDARAAEVIAPIRDTALRLRDEIGRD